MEQNSGRIDPTPRPPRSPPASFSRVPVVPALGRTGKLGHIRLSRPDAGLGASPLPSLAVQPTLGAGHGPAGPNGPRPHPAPTRARVGRTPPPRDARTAEVPETGAASIGRLPSPSPGYQTETHKHPPQFNIPSPVGATDWLPWAWPPPPPEPVEESQELPINPSMHALC